MAKSIVVTALALMALAAIVAGCGDDDDKGTRNPPAHVIPAELVGVWTFQSGTANGVNVPLDIFLFFMEDATQARMTVSSGGTYVLDNRDANDSVLLAIPGEITVSGNHFSLTGLEGLPIEGGNWAVTQDQLILSTTLDVENESWNCELLATRPATTSTGDRGPVQRTER